MLAHMREGPPPRKRRPFGYRFASIARYETKALTLEDQFWRCVWSLVASGEHWTAGEPMVVSAAFEVA